MIPLLSLLLPVATGIAGALSNRPRTQTTDSQQNTNQSSNNRSVGSTETSGNSSTNTSQQNQQSGTSVTTPNLDDATQNYLNTLRNAYMTNIKGQDLSGYQTQGLKQINDASTLKSLNLGNALTSRGLNTSPVGAIAQTNLDNQRIDQTAQFNAQLPLLQRQIANEDLSAASSFFSRIPLGQTTTSSSAGQQTSQSEMESFQRALQDFIQSQNSNVNSTSHSTGFDPGNQLGGGFTGIAQALAFLFGQGNK